MTCRQFATGYTDGYFHPSLQVTRAQFVRFFVKAFLWRSETPIPPTPTPTGCTFSDVPTSHWAYYFIRAACARGVVSGQSDGKFYPDNYITRAEVAAMIVRTGGWSLYTPASPSFVDVSTSYWAYAYIETARWVGAMNGIDATHFSPNVYINRADSAVTVFKGSNGPSNGMFGHCCLAPTPGIPGQYEGSNNMTYAFNNDIHLVNPIIPGGRMQGSPGLNGQQIHAYITDTMWTPISLNWLVAHEHDGGYNNEVAIVFHSYREWDGSNSCSSGSWGGYTGNFPNIQFLPKPACAGGDNSELRIYPYTVTSLTPQPTGRYWVEAYWNSTDGTYRKARINVDNYWMQRDGTSEFHKDYMNSFCYDIRHYDPEVRWCPPPPWPTPSPAFGTW